MLAPVPVTQPVVNPSTGLVSTVWAQWFRDLEQDQSPLTVTNTTVTIQRTVIATALEGPLDAAFLTGTIAWERLPSGAGVWTATATITGALTLQSTLSVAAGATFGAAVLPSAPDTCDLGSATKPWRNAYISQLRGVAFYLTAQTIFGGYSTVAKQAGTLAAAVPSSATTINFGQAMTPGDIVLFRAFDLTGAVRVEYVSVGALVSGTTYNVTRDLSAASTYPPDWPSATPYLTLGASGDGRIDLLAYDGKPRIVWTQQGATYNVSNDRAVVGNLNGYFGYAADIYGAAFGSPTAANITIEPTNGIRVRNGTTNLLTITPAGSMSLVGTLSVTGSGSFQAGAGAVVLDATGLFISPVAASGGGAYANTNAVRWTTDTTYRTVIWRSDDTLATVKTWSFEHVTDFASTAQSRLYQIQKGGQSGGNFAVTRVYHFGDPSNASLRLHARSEGSVSTTYPVMEFWGGSTPSFQSLVLGIGTMGSDNSAGTTTLTHGLTLSNSGAFFTDGLFTWGRGIADGDWQTIAYAAGNYSQNAGAWTVAAGSQTTLAYVLNGKSCTVAILLTNTTTSAAIGSELYVNIPFTVAVAQVRVGIDAFNGVTRINGYALAVPGETRIRLRVDSTGNWPVIAGTLNIYAEITFPIA